MPVPTELRLKQISLSGRVLGQLLSAPPGDEPCRSLLATMADRGWINEWPYGEPSVLQEIADLLAAGMADMANETPDDAFQRLFIGPYALQAPPWGSVYLDKENVLFGVSTLALRRWLRANAIEMDNDGHEPEDHIATLMLLCAWLAEQRQDALLDTLLAQQLFPWSGRYLALLAENARHPFYQAVAKLAQVTLAHWQRGCGINVPVLELYF